MKLIISISLTITIFFTSLAWAEDKEILYWVAPMNPNYKMDKPGKSPMGMDLVPVYAEDKKETKTTKSQNKSDRAVVSIPPETIQNIGIRVEKVEKTIFGSLIRSYGEVTENIRLQNDISTRVSGWVKALKIKAEGDEVKKGDLLFKLDSPELISAQRDYISAIKGGIKWRITSSRARLVSLGIQDMAINEIAKQNKELSYVSFYATQDGIVSDINIREGSHVSPGMTVISIQNYSSIWIDASIAEKDISYIDKATKASVSFPNLGIKKRQATIDYIYPTINSQTRTGSIRLILDNTNRKIKPGSYADVEFTTNIEARLSVPSSSILKSKNGDFVVLSIGEGKFRPRKILTGVHYKNRTEVLYGLTQDDNIVTSGQFLIDSESSLLESFDKMKKMQTPLNEIEVSKKQLAIIDKFIIGRSLGIYRNLSQNTIPFETEVVPALQEMRLLIPMFRGTALELILEDTNLALIDSQKNVTSTDWKRTLNKLVIALKPWILEGRPEHYKSEGLILYMDTPLRKYWLATTKATKSPYGSSKFEKIDYRNGDKNAK
jgi:membrane fusion protein, copper/silver efflux system